MPGGLAGAMARVSAMSGILPNAVAILDVLERAPGPGGAPRRRHLAKPLRWRALLRDVRPAPHLRPPVPLRTA